MRVNSMFCILTPVNLLLPTLYKIISSFRRDSFTSSFLILFYFPAQLSRLESPLKCYGSSKSCHPCLICDLRWKVFNHSPLWMMLAMSCSQMLFIRFRGFPSIPSLVDVFYHKEVLDVAKCLFCSYGDDHVFFFLSFCRY